MSNDIAIKVENVSKVYPIFLSPQDRLKQMILPHLRRSFGLKPIAFYKEFWALRHISFTVNKGETVGILGRNGSGKSTLLQIIAGTLSPTVGEVHANGLMAALLELGSGFNPEFTGRENIYLNGSILGFSKSEMDSRFDEIAAFADIGEHIHQPVKTYSSGMTVRLAFAVQACLMPHVLIVDEALSVGDEKFQRKCFDYIERLRENGCSILLVTHSTATVEKFCQRGILLHKGEIHGLGPAKDIVDQYHALLYSDEKAYVRYQKATSQSAAVTRPFSYSCSSELQGSDEQDISSSSGEIRAIISGWLIVDSEGNRCEHFKSGDKMTIRFNVDVVNPIKELQAGILFRTVEGVSAFGTSTLYHKSNYKNAKKGSRLICEFRLRASLCAGTYFVTLAIAEAISHGDMLYLDRKTDIVVVQINQMPILASGIAMLDSVAKISETGMDV
jgi:lipopolysaccharide transport system ATP-binding protein